MNNSPNLVGIFDLMAGFNDFSNQVKLEPDFMNQVKLEPDFINQVKLEPELQPPQPQQQQQQQDHHHQHQHNLQQQVSLKRLVKTNE